MNSNIDKVVFIIPAFNEEANIGRTINSIRAYAGAESEIVVIDNGSDDRTLHIASSLGAECFLQPELTIGELRNFGVHQTKQSILIFLDADVELTSSWKDEIEHVMTELSINDNLITGSHCSPPAGDNWFLKYWFASFASENNSTHIGTGHMIVSRRLFLELGGFKKELQTGEDYDFCARAVKNGARVVNNRRLKVYHFDFPLTPLQFIKREAWHGIGDVGSVKAIFSSKVSFLSLVFFALHILIAVLIAINIKMIWMPILTIIFLCIFSAFVKYRHAGARAVFCNSIIFYLYFFGRVGSFFYKVRKL